MGALVFGERFRGIGAVNADDAHAGRRRGRADSLSADGAFLFYATNAGDIERRHVWRVPTAGGAAEQLTSGETIETYPAVLASGRGRRPRRRREASVRRRSRAGERRRGEIHLSVARRISDRRRSRAAARDDESGRRHWRSTTSCSCRRICKPGERRPAIVFVHGGPVRQMLLGYHYMHFYHVAYAVNQWLASQGYVVMSINYRSGIGYGKSFRTAPNTGGRGNAEYQDVLAGGKYLQSRPDVDPNRVGIWGLSYGGVLTVAGAGAELRHLQSRRRPRRRAPVGQLLDPEQRVVSSRRRSRRSTSGSRRCCSIQGDDDRNVQFSQMPAWSSCCARTTSTTK